MTGTVEIMLASDFTARSDRPLDRALQLAREWSGKLVIAHVMEKGGSDVDTAITERLRRELPEEAEGSELVVRTGSAPKVLTQIAAERGSTLIVTGVARYNSIGDYVLGTAVDHIVRNAGAPVLVVRRRTKGPYRHVLVATDLSDCSLAALHTAASFFPDARISLVHAFHVPYEGWLNSDKVKQDVRAEAQQSLDEFIAQADMPTELRQRVVALVDAGDIAGVITRHLDETGADLLVLGTHGRSGFAHATIGSHAESLLSVVNVDVVMVRVHSS